MVQQPHRQKSDAGKETDMFLQPTRPLLNAATMAVGEECALDPVPVSLLTHSDTLANTRVTSRGLRLLRCENKVLEISV